MLVISDASGINISTETNISSGEFEKLGIKTSLG